MVLPCYCHDIAMLLLPRIRHSIAMVVACHYHAVAMSLPCCRHAIAMLLPCYCHAIADAIADVNKVYAKNEDATHCCLFPAVI